MANLFVNLPLPALNGPGAAVVTGTMGAPKTITVIGNFPGATITVEASVDGFGAVFAPIPTALFQSNANKIVVDVAAQFMRVVVSGRKAAVPFAANIDVGANDNGALFANIAMPAFNGPGAATNIAAHGSLSTFVAGGVFPGAAVQVEISEDGTDWAPVVQFTDQGGLQTRDITANFVRANVSGRKVSLPFTGSLAIGSIVDATAGAGAGGSGNCLIYRPGSGLLGPVVFDAWADLIAQLAVLRADANGSGCYEIVFDDSIVTPCPIPVGAYDMTMVTWAGILGTTSAVSVPEGVTFTQLRRFVDDVSVEFTGLTPPISDFSPNEVVALFTGAEISATGTGPLFRNSIAVGQVIFVLDRGSVVTGTTPVIDAAGVGGTTTVLLSSTLATLEDDTISSVVGATVVIATGASGIALASETHPSLAGTLLPFNSTKSRIDPTPLPPALAVTVDTVLTAANALVLVDPGTLFPVPLQITLPPAAGATVNRGQTVIIKNVNGAPGLIAVVPDGLDVIDGYITGQVLFNVPMGVLTLVSDGVATWRVITPSLYAPPEQWAQTDIQPNQVAVALSCAVSTNFDDLRMIRPGTVVGLGTRLTSPVTAGTITVNVTVNGVAGALQVIHTAGSNPDGGSDVQPIGFNVDSYNAGDLIGVQITTDAGLTFAVDSNIEVWLEIAEFGFRFTPPP